MANIAPAADLRALRAFVAVARLGTVSGAARLLNLSQPAVSLQLRHLAHDCGLTLFARAPHGLTLTRDGMALLPHAERSLAALEAFALAAQHVGQSVRGVLRVGTILDPEFTRLGAFLSALVGLAPDLQPELQQRMSGEVLTAVQQGDLDVGYYVAAGADDVSLHGMHFVELTRFDYQVIAPPGWQARLRGRDWPDLAELPWILTPPASVHHRLLSRALAPLGLALTGVALVDQEASMLALVRSGVGLSLCRDAIAIHELQVQGVAVADRVRLPATLGLVCRTAVLQRPAVRCALDALARAWDAGKPG